MRKLFKENKRVISIAIGLEILSYISFIAGYPHALPLMLGFAFLAPAIAACFAKDKRFLLGFIIVGGKLVFDLTLALVLLTVFPPQREELGMTVVFGAVILASVVIAGLAGAVVGGVFGMIKERSKMTKKELVSILISAVLVTGISWPLTASFQFPEFLEGYGDGWGWPINYVGTFTWLTGKYEDIVGINWLIFVADILFWFVVLAVGWWVVERIRRRV